MYNIKVNRDKNYLILAVMGDTAISEIEKAELELYKFADELRKPFSMILDIREWNSVDPDAVKLIMRMMIGMRAKGLKHVARVVKGLELGPGVLKTYQEAHAKAGLVFARYFFNLEDAINYIEYALDLNEDNTPSH